MNVARKLRVVVVDDSEVVRMKLRGLLEADDAFEQVGEAADGETGLKVVQEQQPDVVIMDLRMPGMSGIEATWQLGTIAPQSKVLVLTVSAEQEDVTDAIMAGARGYVVKGARDDEIIAALRGVTAGERVISPQVAGKLIERVRGDRAEGKAMTPSPSAPSAPRVPSSALRERSAGAPPTVGGPNENASAAESGSALGELLQPKYLGQTLTIASVAAAFLILIGEGDAEVWLEALLGVLIAFVVINLGVLIGKNTV